MRDSDLAYSSLGHIVLMLWHVMTCAMRYTVYADADHSRILAFRSLLPGPVRLPLLRMKRAIATTFG